MLDMYILPSLSEMPGCFREEQELGSNESKSKHRQ
jgi:hypothetical protein